MRGRALLGPADPERAGLVDVVLRVRLGRDASDLGRGTVQTRQ